MQSARGGGLKIPRNSLENEVDFQFPKTSRNSKFFSVFISGRIQARPEGNSVQPFVLPGFYFIFFFQGKAGGGCSTGNIWCRSGWELCCGTVRGVLDPIFPGGNSGPWDGAWNCGSTFPFLLFIGMSQGLEFH